MSISATYTQFIALALAIASTVFIYVKLAASLSFFFLSLAYPTLTLPSRTRAGPQPKGIPGIRAQGENSRISQHCHVRFFRFRRVPALYLF